MKIKYDLNLMKFMSFFESLTNTRLKDCFIDKNSLLVFVVKENQIAKAIGKKGVNVRNIKEKLNRKIKIVEFNPHLETFVANIIRPLIGKEIKVDDNVVTITGPDTKTKGLLIGRNGQNLRNYEEIVNRYFDIKEIKVI